MSDPQHRSVDDLVAATVEDPAAGLAVGTFGAIAEFLRAPGASSHVEHGDRTHTAITEGGAVRIRVDDDVVARAWRRPTGPGTGWTQAVALCLPADRAAGPERTVVTVLGPDPDPLLGDSESDSSDGAGSGGGAVLVDLGLGVAHLEACVRTADPELLAVLHAAAGRPLDGEVTAALVAAGPTRVFRTALTRVEVATPIPPPTGQSPAGPHTHLLPALLAHRRTHAATDPLPDGTVPVASLFPPHPSRDQLGRPRPVDVAADEAFERTVREFGDPDEARWHSWVHEAVGRGAAAQDPPDGLSRAGRRGWETALRRREVVDGPSDTLAAWRARTRPTPEPPDSQDPNEADDSDDSGRPFHEAHDS